MAALLLGADYYGTLAAARALGAGGVEVVMADDERTAIGLFSHFVAERRVCPPVDDARFLPWLLEQGRASREKPVLYPTNDHLAWLLAAHRAELEPLFHLYQPAETVIFNLLDKLRLSEAARAVGLEVPRTRVAESMAALEEAAQHFGFPLLLKPRTQIFLASGLKGELVTSAEALKEKAEAFRQLVVYAPMLERLHPEVRAPLVQEYLPAAETAVFSLSGFRSREGELVTRGAMKVLQRPRKLGIGLCFEGRPVEPELEAKLGALCERVGYFGTFEAEFIVAGERRLLIDFNPRYYSQMGFDVARGLNHPLLTYFGARGDWREVARLLADARAWQPRGAEAYCHRAVLELVLRAQSLSGRMSPDEVTRWRAWLAGHEGQLVHATWARGDPLPAVIDTARYVEHFARHPRSFVRHYVLNQ